MNYPFYANRYAYPQTSHRYYDHQHKTTPSRKVVMIPVADGSERTSPPSQSKPAIMLDSAVVKIQKVFRGFLVRKSVRKIGEIRSEVNEIEKMILMEESVELIRKDTKERLKVNEMLMGLLLRLDSVRGVDSGVRDLRKAVIKKAIRLQEIVDSIVANTDNNFANNDEDEEEGGGGVSNVANSNSNFNSKSVENQTQELLNHVDSIMPVMHDGDSNVNEKLNEIKENVNEDEEEENASECAESMDMSQGGSQADSSANPQSLVEGDEEECDDADDENQKEEGDVTVKDEDQCCGGGEGNKEKGEEEEEEEVVSGNKSRQLLEKMMEDNEKMMGLMAQLFERNEMQTRLLSSLSRRVEQLERALSCERSKRNKKKRNSAGVADCLESTQDSKKYGKK